MNWIKRHLVWLMLEGVVLLFLLNFSMVFFISDENILVEGVDVGTYSESAYVKTKPMEKEKNDGNQPVC